jgi:hypothetical protein
MTLLNNGWQDDTFSQAWQDEAVRQMKRSLLPIHSMASIKTSPLLAASPWPAGYLSSSIAANG